jgi:hypothetical protein
MNADATPFPHDEDYAETVAMTTLDGLNAAMTRHLKECQFCQREPFGHCPVALSLIANPPAIVPALN